MKLLIVFLICVFAVGWFLFAPEPIPLPEKPEEYKYASPYPTALPRESNYIVTTY